MSGCFALSHTLPVRVCSHTRCHASRAISVRPVSDPIPQPVTAVLYLGVSQLHTHYMFVFEHTHARCHASCAISAQGVMSILVTPLLYLSVSQCHTRHMHGFAHTRTLSCCGRHTRDCERPLRYVISRVFTVRNFAVTWTLHVQRYPSLTACVGGRVMEARRGYQALGSSRSPWYGV